MKPAVVLLSSSVAIDDLFVLISSGGRNKMNHSCTVVTQMSICDDYYIEQLIH